MYFPVSLRIQQLTYHNTYRTSSFAPFTLPCASASTPVLPPRWLCDWFTFVRVMISHTFQFSCVSPDCSVCLRLCVSPHSFAKYYVSWSFFSVPSLGSLCIITQTFFLLCLILPTLCFVRLKTPPACFSWFCSCLTIWIGLPEFIAYCWPALASCLPPCSQPIWLSKTFSLAAWFFNLLYDLWHRTGWTRTNAVTCNSPLTTCWILLKTLS